jgi:hypothetical protein
MCVGADVVDVDDIDMARLQPLETAFQRRFNAVTGIVVANSVRKRVEKTVGLLQRSSR